MPSRNKPMTVAVSSESGAYLLTRDKGERSWRRRGPLLKKENVNSVSYDQKAGRLYAATHSDGVFLSDDMGRSWKNSNGGLHVRKVWTVQPNPSRAEEAYAGTHYGHLFRTEDAGESWEEVSGLFTAPGRNEWGVDWGFGTTGLCIHTIRIDPRNSDRIFIVVSGNGPYRTDDKGATWKRLFDGVMESCPVGLDKNAPTIPKIEQDKKLEEHLKQVHACTHKLVLSKSDPDFVFQQNHCGVFKSKNGGDSWEDVSPQPDARHGFPIVFSENGRRTVFTIPAYQGPENGGCKKHNSCIRGQLAVLRTGDDGTTWEWLTTGLPKGVHTCVLRDAMSSGPDGVYFGTTTGEVFGSGNGGESWDLLLDGVGRIQGVSSFAGT